MAPQPVQPMIRDARASAGHRVARHVVDVDEVVVRPRGEEFAVGRVLYLVYGLVAVVKFAPGLIRSLHHLVELAGEHVVVV